MSQFIDCPAPNWPAPWISYLQHRYRRGHGSSPGKTGFFQAFFFVIAEVGALTARTFTTFISSFRDSNI